MKNIVVLIAFLLSAGISKAQIDVKVNPLAALFENINVSVEFKLAESWGLDIAPILDFSKQDYNSVEYKYNRFGVVANPRYYFNQNLGLDKWYLGAYIKFASGSAKADDVEGWSNTRLAGGINGGYKVVTAGNFIFDIGLGVGRAFVNNYDGSLTGFNEDLLEAIDIDFIGTLAIGYRF